MQLDTVTPPTTRVPSRALPQSPASADATGKMCDLLGHTSIPHHLSAPNTASAFWVALEHRNSPWSATRTLETFLPRIATVDGYQRKRPTGAALGDFR